MDIEESLALAEWLWDTRCRAQGSVRCAGEGGRRRQRAQGERFWGRLATGGVVPRAAMRGQDMGTEELSE